MVSMEAFAEGLVLIGGVLVFGAFGYYAISKLGDFLEHNNAYMDTEYHWRKKRECRPFMMEFVQKLCGQHG